MKLNRIANNVSTITLSDDTTVLFSYNTPVAACVAGAGFLRTEKQHGRTTSKHINQWLDGVTAQTRPQSFFDDLVR